jgi:hypothetical protein
MHTSLAPLSVRLPSDCRRRSGSNWSQISNWSQFPTAKSAETHDGHFDAVLRHFRAALQGVDVHTHILEKIMKLLENKRAAVLSR